MKKTFIIIGGIIFIVALIGIWLYLFIFGTPENIEETMQNFPTSSGESTSVSDGFNFDESDTQNSSEEDDVSSDTVSQLNISQSAVSQLTTNPVAGFSFRDDNEIVYVEAGTGHIFSVNLNDGQQIRISNNTLAQTRRALFSPDNSIILLFADNMMRITILENNNLRVGSPIIAPKNIKIDSDNNILHTVSNDRNTSGFSTNTSTGETETLFTIPLKDPVIVWGERINSRHFAYPRPAIGLQGRLFEIRNDTLRFTPVSGTNLTIIRSDNDFITNLRSTTDGENIIWRGGDTTSSANFIPSVLYNEKCTEMSDVLLCAKSEDTNTSINDWYKGIVSFNDNLWTLNLNQETAQEIINLEQATGRMIDVDTITSNSDGTKILFRNKIDGNIWLFNNPEPIVSSIDDDTE